MTRTRPRIVLYNPRAVFFTMPLALVAIGSAIDRARFDVVVIDGRLERDPARRVIAEAEGALCVGISVLTGSPLRDALHVSRALKAARPAVPVIWGGWHPSLLPTACLEEPSIDVAVIGQGEETLRDLVERLASGGSLDGCTGIAVRSGGAPHVMAARRLYDLNVLPPHEYTLIDVETYFQRKRKRQLDYVSSQGCRFRCTFCADPAVYGRAWTGLSPARIGDETHALWQRYGFEELAFQDETLFTQPARIDALCEEFLARGAPFHWIGTLRADQGERMSDDLFAKARRAGLTRVMIGAESGSQAVLDWMKKDATVPQVLTCAERCARHGIAAIFNFIIGFPDEPEVSVRETLALIKRLRAMRPDFETPIFYYRPYPGSEIADAALAAGYRFPKTLDEWADFDYVGSRGPWVTLERWRHVERFKFYVRHAWNAASGGRWPLRLAARWRCAHDCYAFPIEKHLVELLRRPEPLS
jgi:radical SAM superfamily enzyme YgiQ (UPF0313 family)